VEPHGKEGGSTWLENVAEAVSRKAAEDVDATCQTRQWVGIADALSEENVPRRHCKMAYKARRLA
jgi:hypothetical protein